MSKLKEKKVEGKTSPSLAPIICQVTAASYTAVARVSFLDFSLMEKCGQLVTFHQSGQFG